MNTEQATTYLQALLATVTIGVIVPLVILFTLLGVVGYLLVKAQRKPDFNIERVLMDEENKPSSMRLIALMSFAFSSWYLAVKVINGRTDPQEFFYYLAAWSGAVVFVKFAERWNGQLPWSGGGQP